MDEGVWGDDMRSLIEPLRGNFNLDEGVWGGVTLGDSSKEVLFAERYVCVEDMRIRMAEGGVV